MLYYINHIFFSLNYLMKLNNINRVYKLFSTIINKCNKLVMQPIMIFAGRFRYRFFFEQMADSDFDTDYFPLSNQQEIMKDSNTNKVVDIWI